MQVVESLPLMVVEALYTHSNGLTSLGLINIVVNAASVTAALWKRALLVVAEARKDLQLARDAHTRNERTFHGSAEADDDALPGHASFVALE